jgi:hypothetical protein
VNHVPIKSSSELIPFINSLEQQTSTLQMLVSRLEETLDGMARYMGDVNMRQDSQLDTLRKTALTATVKAEDALAEINNATFGIAAVRGQKLKTLLDDLRTRLESMEQYVSTEKDEIRDYFYLRSPDQTIWKVTIDDDGALDSQRAEGETTVEGYPTSYRQDGFIS